MASLQQKPASGLSRIFRGHGRAIFLGLVAGAAVIFGIGWFMSPVDSRAYEFRKLMEVATHHLSGLPQSDATPEPIVVQLSPDLVQVTAIALGHPRLAVINGKSLAEGDRFVVHTPTYSVAVTLRVLRISDGHVDFSDGTQVVSARLTKPSSSTKP
jgi:hypothetical protein